MLLGPAANQGVLVCGTIVADLLVRPVAEPGWGKTTWVETITLGLGGNGGSSSYALAKLGIPARLISVVGDDDFGITMIERLRSCGVDTTNVERSASAPTATSAALVHPDGRRALLLRPGAAREAFPNGIRLTPELISGCSGLHVGNIFGLPCFQRHAPDLLRQARELGMWRSMDTAWDPQGLWMKTIGPCLRYVDWLFVNEEEAFQLTGSRDPDDAADGLREHGASSVVIKLGAAGCLVAIDGEHFRSSGFVVEAVDTTGAGDCFAAGFLAALHRGFDYRRAARFANAVGALSVSKLGAVTGLLGFADTERFATAGEAEDSEQRHSEQ